MKSTVSYREKRHPLLRLINAIGKPFLNTKLLWINLDEERLFAAARWRARYDDFGPDNFLEPFRVLLEAAKNEGKLTFVGRISARESAIAGLVMRLGMQREIAMHPEIPELPVRRPLIVVGMPRSGTTFLQHLLALDPAGRHLVAWEAISPPPITVGRKHWFDFRTLYTAVLVWMTKFFLTPETALMHKYSYNGPAECTALIWPSFVWPMAIVLPSVHAWLKNVGESVYKDAYEVYRLALQILHRQRPAEDHWVLKSPQHVWAMGALARAVPEATIVHTHRNLNEVMPSFCSLSAVFISMYTDTLKPERIGPKAMEFAGEIIDRMQQARSEVDGSRICDVRYPDLVGDPIGTVRRIYDEHGYQFTPEYEAALKQWLDQDRKAGRAKHVYSHDRFGLDREEIATAFADYHRKYGVE